MIKEIFFFKNYTENEGERPLFVFFLKALYEVRASVSQFSLNIF